MSFANISFISKPTNVFNENLYIISVDENLELSDFGQYIDELFSGKISRALKDVFFYGKKGKSRLFNFKLNGELFHILVFGIGDKYSINSSFEREKLGAELFSSYTKIDCNCDEKYDLDQCECPNKVIIDISLNDEHIADIASGFMLRSWKFDKYKTKKNIKKIQKDDNKKDINFNFIEDRIAHRYFNDLLSVNQGNFITRELITLPPNDLNPEIMADIAKELTSIGIEVEVIGEAQLRELGLNAMMAVGKGSAHESKLIVLKWMNGGDSDLVSLVGKGVTFDSGGISLKPSKGMEDMKYDMAGSGVVLGAMKTLALRKAKINVVGIMGMVENMPSGTSMRPSDIVTSYSGQTIEIANTDAEGRLVLADALTYAQKHFNPKYIIDFATLTGAIVVALGHEYAGLFSNDGNLAKTLIKAGQDTGELVWMMPMSKREEGYDKDIDSDIADVKNIGSNRGAGATTAAQFLRRFINEEDKIVKKNSDSDKEWNSSNNSESELDNVKWAHIDIAGVTWDTKNKELFAKGATGFGVRLINQWIKENIEKK